MKLKLYEEFKNTQEIEKICRQYGIYAYSINQNGSVDVRSSVIINRYTTKFPLEFGKVEGSFMCDYIGLSTLENCPKEVLGDFSCGGSNLTSLDGLEDTIIRGDIVAWDCKNLYCLDGFPIDFKGEFFCDDTPIEPIYNRYIKDTHFEGSNRLAQAIQFFNQLKVVEEGSFGWEISYRKLLEYLKRYKEFGRPTKEEVQDLVGDKYIVR